MQTAENNFNTLNYFFMTLIGSCCLVLALPYMANYPNTLLFCYFFIMVSVIALFFTWYFYGKNKASMIYYVLPSLLFIATSLGAAFLMISANKTKITAGNVTPYYFKFNLVIIWLILIECYLFYHLYKLIDEGNSAKNIMLIIITFCILNYFTIWSNSIGLKYFSADG